MVQSEGKVKEQITAKMTSLNLTGSLTVKHAKVLREDLLKALNDGTTININLEEITEIDLSSMQLLCSAHRYALNKGKNLSLNDPEGNLFSAGKTAGFNGGKKCRFDRNNGCLWMEDRK